MIVKRGQQLMLPIKKEKLLKSNISKINDDKDRFSVMSFSGKHKTPVSMQVKSGIMLMAMALLAGVKMQASLSKTENPINQNDLVENVEEGSINVINLNLQPAIPQQAREKNTISNENKDEDSTNVINLNLRPAMPEQAKEKNTVSNENKELVNKSVDPVETSPISEKNKQTAMNKIDINKPITTFGDSTAYGLGYYFENNLGVSSAGFLRPIKFKSLSNIKAGDQIIISLGYNDPDAAKDPKKYTAKVVDLVKGMQNKGAKVAIIGIKAQLNTSYNRRIAILNDALKEAAVQTNIQFVDISKFGLEQSDGVHFKDNKTFASKIRKALL